MKKPELSEDLRKELDHDKKEARKYLLVWPIMGFSLIAMVGFFWKMYYIPIQKEPIEILQEINYPPVNSSEEAAADLPVDEPSVVTPTSTPVPTSTPSSQRTHTVSEGESLWSIANKYQVTVESIKKANGLTTENLKINQKLLIP
jgi:cytoskeletal protein RodZ